MRADRLLSLLMLLQSQGRMTAKKLAEKLEVSERTIYRDIDALCAAGVPIYAETGREGGYDLLDSYRTSLTGLNERELRALFMLSVPAPLSELGMSQDLQAALLKISTSLPESRQQDGIRVRQRFYLDWNWWHRLEEPLPFLQAIERAVWQDCRLIIRYRPLSLFEMERIVDPYALVAKAGVWYLVYEASGRMQARRVSSLLDVKVTEENFPRQADFDLAEFWAGWCARREQSYSSYPVIVLVEEKFAPDLPHYFVDGIRRVVKPAGPSDVEGKVRLEISFESLGEARAILLGLGSSVEVLAPPALRLSMEDYAWQIVGVYRSGS
ncbi:MAG: helix-turn-helix transcriptional regulator [Anaerolineales bacterium]